jgi:hypothetical protein
MCLLIFCLDAFWTFNITIRIMFYVHILTFLLSGVTLCILPYCFLPTCLFFKLNPLSWPVMSPEQINECLAHYMFIEFYWIIFLTKLTA